MKRQYYDSAGKSATKPKHVFLRRTVTESKGWGKLASDIMSAKPATHEPWKWQPLIMADPFVPTFVRTS